MPYPRHLVNEGETVVLDLRPHWWYFSKHILTGVPLVLVFALLFRLDGTGRTVADWAWGILAIAWALWLVVKYLDWTFTHFVVTDKRVVFRTGVIAKRGTEIPLDRVSNINFGQSIWNRLIGAGDLDIESAGRDGQSHFDNVRHPDGVQQEIYRQMDADARRQAHWAAPRAGVAPTPVPPTIPEQIEQLARLRDQGRITSGEYEAKKAELLRRM